MEPKRVAGYIRVSTRGQGDSRAGLDAQRRAIEAAAELRGWRVCVFEEVASARTRDRAVLESAIASVENGKCDALVIARQDRLARPVKDLIYLVDRATDQGWPLVMLDADIDLTSADGEYIATIKAAGAQRELRLISERTREALAARKAAGVRLGRPPGFGAVIPPDTRERIFRHRRRGRTLQQIADYLNNAYRAIPTPSGRGRWYPSMVKRVLATKWQRPLPREQTEVERLAVEAFGRAIAEE